MSIRALAAALITGAVALVATATPADAASRVQFRYIQYDSPGSDNRSNASLNAEYVTIRNVSGSRISLKGWHLYDKVGHKYSFGKFTIAPRTAVKIRTGRGSNNATNRYWGSGNYVWNNDGDRARIRDASGKLVDQCSWGDGPGGINC